MPFPVQLTAHAVGDLEDILAYIDRRDGPNRVEQVLDQIEQTLQGLSHHSTTEVTPTSSWIWVFVSTGRICRDHTASSTG